MTGGSACGQEPWLGMETVSFKICAHLWYETIFLFLEQITPPWRDIFARIHARVGGSRLDVVTLPDQNGEFEEILLQIFHSDGRE